MKKKIFILGIGSLTGYKIANQAQNDFLVSGSYNLRNPELEFITSYKLDILNLKNLEKLLIECDPDYIINSCALNNVDYCESHPEEANKINSKFVANLSKISKFLNSKLIHLSSDSVFDGSKQTPYTETDVANPINIYGNSKFSGEKFALNNPDNLVVRASVLYGWLPTNLSNKSSSSMKPQNFVFWLINKLNSNEEVNIIEDEISSPIIVDDFANSIMHLLKRNSSGIYHSAPNVCINRYEFSKKIAEELELDSNLIKPISNKELGRNVKTGINKCLDSSKIQTSTKFKFLTVNESLSLLKKQFLIN